MIAVNGDQFREHGASWRVAASKWATPRKFGIPYMREVLSAPVNGMKSNRDVCAVVSRIPATMRPFDTAPKTATHWMKLRIPPCARRGEWWRGLGRPQAVDGQPRRQAAQFALNKLKPYRQNTKNHHLKARNVKLGGPKLAEARQTGLPLTASRPTCCLLFGKFKRAASSPDGRGATKFSSRASTVAHAAKAINQELTQPLRGGLRDSPNRCGRALTWENSSSLGLRDIVACPDAMAMKSGRIAMFRWFMEDLATLAALMLAVAIIAAWAVMLGG